MCEALEVTCKVIEEVKKMTTCALSCELCISYYDGVGCRGVGKATTCVVFFGIGATVGGLTCVASEISGA